MALTFTEATEQGFDAWSALQSGQLITDFTYLMQEKPDIYQDLIMTYRDPLIAQFLLEANVNKGSTSSDQNRWYEAGRIQNSWTDSVTLGAWTAGVATLTMPSANHDIKPKQTLMIGDNANNTIQEVYVSAVAGAAVTVQSRLATPAVAAGASTSVMHLASDHKQGSDIDTTSVTHAGTWRSNNPIIIRDYLAYDRSKLKQIVNFTDDMTRYTIDDNVLQKRFDVAQVLAGVFGIKSEASSATETLGLEGSESVAASIKARGNTVAGSFAAKSDIDNLVKTLNSVKGSKINQLLLDLAGVQDLDNLLGSTDKADPNSYNFGVFGQDIDYRKFGFKGFNSSGWDFMYNHLEVLDDTTYFGAFDGNTAKPKGFCIPKGQVQLASGGSMPYLSFLYRDGMDKQVSKSGAVAGIGHKDELSLSYTTELTPRTVSAKDFIAFS